VKHDSDNPLDNDEDALLKLQKEEEARFILYLVSKAISRHNNDFPSECSKLDIPRYIVLTSCKTKGMERRMPQGVRITLEMKCL